MIVLKTFIRLLLKNLPVILTYVVSFFIINMIISGSLSAPPPDAEAIVRKDSRVAIRDLADTEESRNLVKFFEQRYILVDAGDKSPEELKEAVFTSLIASCIEIPADYLSKLAAGERAVSLLNDPRSISNWQVEMELDRYLRFARALIRGDGIDLEQLDKVLSQQSKLEFRGKQDASEDRNMMNYHYYFRVGSYIVLCVTLILFGQIMYNFNLQGIRSRTRVSGTANRSYQAQILASLLILSATLFIAFVAGALSLYGKPADLASFGLYLVNFAVFCLVSLAVGYLMLSIANNKAMIHMFANAVPLGLAFISGVYIDSDLIGEPVVSISKAFPVYYYVQAIMPGNSSLADQLPNLGIQLLFGVFYIVLALVLNRSKKQTAGV